MPSSFQGAAPSNEQRVIDLQGPVALLTLYCAVRAGQLGINTVDPNLANPLWVQICTEAMQLVNSWMSWDATLAVPAWVAAGYAKPATPQAATPAPAAPVVPTPVATTPAPTATTAITNPVAAAMTALGLRAAS